MKDRNRLWGSDTDDVRGRALESAIDANNYVVLNNGQGTHQTNSGSMTHIDVSLSSRKLATKCKWTTLNNLMGSDHAPILISINARPEQQLSSVPKWKLTSADWTIFRQSVENQIQVVTINEHEEVDQFNSKVVDILITAAEESIPKTRLSLSKRHKPLPYWNNDIKTAIRNRNRARNKMNKTKNIDDCIEYRRLKSIAQRVIRQSSREHWQSFCNTLNSRSRLSTVWNMAKKMNGTKSNPTSGSLIENGNIVELNKDKAEVFARTFASVSSTTNFSPEFQNHKTNVEQNHANLYRNNAPDTEITKHLNREFTSREINLAIDQLKKNKSPGEDRIPYEFF